MLEAIRKQTGGIVVKALLGLLILSFAIWGIGDIGMGGGSSTVAATVGNKEISSYRLQDEVQRRLREFRQLTGQNFTEEQAQSMGIVRATLDQLVDSTLMSQGATKLGLTVSDQQVADAIRESNQFKGALGNFDRQRFMQSLSSLGMSEAGYVQLLREDIARNQMISSLASGVVAPKRLTDDLYRYRQEKRTVETIRIPNSAATNLPKPDEAALVKLHKEKAARFTAPEYRALTVINMTADDLVKEVSVSEEEIKASFDQRVHEFTVAEERDVLQMVFSDQATAKKAHKMLSEGRPFEDVGKEVAGQDKDTLGLGFMTKDQMIPELADAAFTAEKGKSSAPVKSPLGWHIVQVKDIKEGRSKTLAELRDLLKAHVAKDKAIDGLFNLSNRVEDELGGGATLQEAADRLGLKLVKVASVDRTGADASGKAVPGLPKGEFLNIAFSTQSGEDSQMTEAGAEGYFVLRVDGVTPAALKPLETVRKDVIMAWNEIRRADGARKAAEQMAKDIKGTGSNMAELAKHNGFEYKEVKDFLRNQGRGPAALPPVLTGKVFDMVPGESTFSRDGNGYIVARLKTVTPAVLGADKDAHSGLSNALVEGMRRDLLRQLSNGLRKSFGVTINNNAMNNPAYGGTPHGG
jgi:peptidyl-prolyl cis-trans isomerase D